MTLAFWSDSPQMPAEPLFRAVSDSELAVLKCLWEEGPSTPRALQLCLARRGSAWAYTTVQTLLQRLLRKGYVGRERAGATRVYSPRRTRSELLALHLDDLAQRVCDGERSALMRSLVEDGGVTRGDLRRMRAVLEAAEGQPSASRPAPGTG